MSLLGCIVTLFGVGGDDVGYQTVDGIVDSVLALVRHGGIVAVWLVGNAGYTVSSVLSLMPATR